jgi:hypothetical protein
MMKLRLIEETKTQNYKERLSNVTEIALEAINGMRPAKSLNFID